MNEQCAEIILDDADYRVFYDYLRAEPANYDVESTSVGPGHEACVEINRIEFRPHGYRNWLQTDINLWDAKSKVWQFLSQECLERSLCPF